MTGRAPAFPQRLGRYEVLRHLATGGMAEVLLARTSGMLGFEHHVVIKRIRPAQARDARFVRMFLDEARLAASLHHQNIVQVHDIGEDRGEYFFAMEYVHGEDLRGILTEAARQSGALPVEQILAFTVAAAAGLHYAHRKCGNDGAPLGIVHRDVSPANILVGYDGSVKVGDFGIAKATMVAAETRSGTLKGKCAYMSPEQVTGHPLDARSDVFSLGIVLFELLTGRRLFKGENDWLTMHSIISGDIPPPSQFRRGLADVIDKIVGKALARDPDDRYRSADELRAALERAAVASGAVLSSKKIADFMTALCGTRPEPWLVDDDPTNLAERPDFDATALGVVATPPPRDGELAVPEHLAPSPTSPIALMQETAITAIEGGVTDADTPPVTSIDLAPFEAHTETTEADLLPQPGFAEMRRISDADDDVAQVARKIKEELHGAPAPAPAATERGAPTAAPARFARRGSTRRIAAIAGIVALVAVIAAVIVTWRIVRRPDDRAQSPPIDAVAPAPALAATPTAPPTAPDAAASATLDAGAPDDAPPPETDDTASDPEPSPAAVAPHEPVRRTKKHVHRTRRDSKPPADQLMRP